MTVEKVLSEGQQPGGSMPAGWVFTATTNGLPGGSTVSYKISKCPNGCTGNAFSSCGSSTGAPFSIGASDGQMGLSNSLNAEACTTTYKIQIKATAKDSSSNILATAKCNLNIAVGDVNEAPSVDAQVRYIEEESPENTAIGEPLTASDPEVAVNKQELVWSITACNNNGAGVSPCPIKISFCSGQLSVSDPTKLDTDVLTDDAYTLTVRVQDSDAKNPLDDTASVIVNVVPKNEPPVILAADNIYYVPEDKSIDGTPVILSP